MHIDVAGSTTPIMAPGMKYRHYAPRIPVRMASSLDHLESVGPRRYIMAGADAPFIPNAHTVCDHDYYAQLRWAETQGYVEVVILVTPQLAANEALMERMKKSASAADKSALGQG